MSNIDLSKLPFDAQSLIDKALKQMELAYCPYSKYKVGSAVLTEDGQIIGGSNVENAAYPVGICAERSALAAAVSAGHLKFKGLVVATKDGGTCCGMCRQFIREFFQPEIPIICVNGQGKVSYLVNIDQLLVHSFGPENLQ